LDSFAASFGASLLRFEERADEEVLASVAAFSSLLDAFCDLERLEVEAPSFGSVAVSPTPPAAAASTAATDMGSRGLLPPEPSPFSVLRLLGDLKFSSGAEAASLFLLPSPLALSLPPSIFSRWGKDDASARIEVPC
jgi:hypothetical protein